jgi:hypothetical protein
MQQDNIKKKKKIKKKIILFVVYKSFKTYNIIDLKIEILDTIIIFSIA